MENLDCRGPGMVGCTASFTFLFRNEAARGYLSTPWAGNNACPPGSKGIKHQLGVATLEQLGSSLL